MYKIIIVCLFYGFLIIAFLAYKCFEYRSKERINNRIKWSLTEPAVSLINYIQKNINEFVSPQYLISTESEQKIAIEIIETYQEKQSAIFLNNEYSTHLSFAKMTFDEFFMSKLCAFLNDNNRFYFHNNLLYKEKSRIYYDKEHYCFDSICEFTPYGVVYNKILYMTILFCEQSQRLNKNHTYHAECIKQSLDTNEAIISRYF